MYLLKITFNKYATYSSDSFSRICESDKECREIISSFPDKFIDSWSIHPLYVQAPVATSEKPTNVNFTVSINYGDNKPWKITHDIAPSSLFDLILEDLDYSDIRFIKLIPRNA